MSPSMSMSASTRRLMTFAEGMGAGAAAIVLALAAIVLLRRGAAPLVVRAVRGPITLPADYPDVCRSAGL